MTSDRSCAPALTLTLIGAVSPCIVNANMGPSGLQPVTDARSVVSVVGSYLYSDLLNVSVCLWIVADAGFSQENCNGGQIHQDNVWQIDIYVFTLSLLNTHVALKQ